MPKTRPLRSANAFRMVILQSRWRSTKHGGKAPAPMKASTLTSERSEKRLSPHTPWPLVQPLPMRTPTPTSRPGDDRRRCPRIDRGCGQRRKQLPRPRRDQQPANEQQPDPFGRQVASGQQGAQRCRHDAGDAGDAAVAQQVEGRGDAYQQPTRERCPGREVVPVEIHGEGAFMVSFPAATRPRAGPPAGGSRGRPEGTGSVSVRVSVVKIC
jgi:hypothetical protein